MRKKGSPTIVTTEDIQDGKRFSRSIPKVTKNKAYIEKAQTLRDKSAERALSIGLIEPQAVVNAPDIETQERKAILKAQAALKIQNAQGMHLSQEDIDFINNLPDDETRDIVIEELFSKKMAKTYRTIVDRCREADRKKMIPPSDKAVKFVRGYIEEYNKILQGREHRTLTEIKEDAGYGASVMVTTILNLPWVANKIEIYHQSIDKLNEYHYMQIRDRKIREQTKVQDIKDHLMNHLLAHPDEMLSAGMRDKTQLLRVMNEMTQTAESRDNGKNGGVPIAIQINGDVARLAMGQDKEKRDHFSQSF